MKKTISAILCIILALVPFCASADTTSLRSIDTFTANFARVMVAVGYQEMLEKMTIGNGQTGERIITMNFGSQLSCAVDLSQNSDVLSVGVTMYAPGGNADFVEFGYVSTCALYALYGDTYDVIDTLGEIVELTSDMPKTSLGAHYKTATLANGIYAFCMVYAPLGLAFVLFDYEDRTDTAEAYANAMVMAML